MRPPAILKAGSVIPKSLKMRVPASEKRPRTRKQVQAAWRAIRRRFSSLSSAVITRNAGIVASGSTMMKIELRHTNENCRIGFSSASIARACSKRGAGRDRAPSYYM